MSKRLASAMLADYTQRAGEVNDRASRRDRFHNSEGEQPSRGNAVQKYMLVLFNLKEGVRPADYEKWAAEVDAPGVRRLGSISSFGVNRVVGTLDGGEPPYRYAELMQVTDFDQLGADAQAEEIQKIGATFQEKFAAEPVFLFLEQFI